MTTAYLFDLDQTLVDRTETVRRFLPHQLFQYGPADAPEPAVFVRRFLELDQNGYANKESVYDVLQQEFKLTACSKELVAHFRSHCFRNAVLFPNVKPLLNKLAARGSRVAIVTNGSVESQSSKIAVTGLDALVDAVIISGQVGLRKPDVRIFHLAAEKLQTTPEQCVFVGDNPERDIIAAACAGMRTVWISHGQDWPASLSTSPTTTLRAVGEMLNLLG